jgi:hypothetical protein
MIAMRVMQVTSHEIIYVITMRHCLMTAIRSMNMALGMTAAIMTMVTTIRIFSRDFKPVFIDMILMRVMQMPIM